MLIVTGASGKLGRRIVEAMLDHVPADQIGVSVRDPGKLPDLAARGIRVREGDYADADSLRRAWNGARRILLVSSNAAAHGGDPLAQHATAIDVARELGVERVLYTAQISTSPDSRFPPGRDHAATEALLSGSGLAWTSLRHGFYADSAVEMNARGFAQGAIRGPEDGKVSWVTHDDLAEVDALFLAGEAVVEGPTAPLTGTEALDLADLAEIASAVSGRPIERQITSEESMVDGAKHADLPQEVIDVMRGYYRAAKAGEFATVDPTLASLLGRPPRTMRDVLTAALG